MVLGNAFEELIKFLDETPELWKSVKLCYPKASNGALHLDNINKTFATTENSSA
jgi:hypothetical protein